MAGCANSMTTSDMWSENQRGYGDSFFIDEVFAGVPDHSHEATRVREREMGRFSSTRQAQRFLGAHAGGSQIQTKASPELEVIDYFLSVLSNPLR